MSKRDQQNKIDGERLGNDGVLITYYVESRTIRAQQRKMKANPFPKRGQATSKRGYDRRAELLAYANELREADPQKLHVCRSSKPNKWKWYITPARLRVLSTRIFQGRKGQWRYKRIDLEENNEADREHGFKCISNMEEKNIGRSSSDFCKKFRSMLRNLSSGCQCYKG